MRQDFKYGSEKGNNKNYYYLLVVYYLLGIVLFYLI